LKQRFLKRENKMTNFNKFCVFYILGIIFMLFALDNFASGKDQIRAGTIEIRSRGTATDEGIATYGFNLTDVVIDESLKLNLVFKMSRGNERVRVYEIERAEVDFEHKISGKTGVEAEAGMVKILVPQQGQLKKELSKSDCDLTLYIDMKKQTYKITGEVIVSNIPFSSKEKVIGKIAGTPPQVEDLSDEWTEDREEEIDIEGELNLEQKDVLEGKESFYGAPGEFVDWTKSFWKGLFGGDIDGSISWEIRVPMLVIEQDGEDITYEFRKNNVQEEIAGKKINLMGKVKPSHLKASDHEWTLPDGKYLKEFRASEDKGEKVELEDSDKKKQEVKFHWYDEGDKLKLIYSADVEGEKLFAEALFNVKKPEIAMRAEIPEGEFTFARVTYLDEEGNKVTGDELIYDPTSESYSIKFTHDPLPNQFPGKTQYVQLVHTVGRVEKHKDVLDLCLEINKKGLDKTYPYSPGPEATDAPGVPVKYLDLNISVKNHYEMYLMFKPEGEGSIFVPLRVMDWDWTGLAERKGINDKFKWDVLGSKIRKDPQDRKAEDYPEWDLRMHEGMKWDVCK
jgi:hypothetical protein